VYVHPEFLRFSTPSPTSLMSEYRSCPYTGIRPFFLLTGGAAKEGTYGRKKGCKTFHNPIPLVDQISPSHFALTMMTYIFAQIGNGARVRTGSAAQTWRNLWDGQVVGHQLRYSIHGEDSLGNVNFVLPCTQLTCVCCVCTIRVRF
jgi:hypothetical protein